MIDQLRTAATTVTKRIGDTRSMNGTFADFCQRSGVKVEDLNDFVESEMDDNGFKEDPEVEAALMRGILLAVEVGAGAYAEGVDWAAVGRLIAPHLLRTSILTHLSTNAMASPNELATLLDSPLGNVSYHVSVLAGGTQAPQRLQADPLLELVSTQPRRGAVEHFYSLTDLARGKRDTDA